MPTKKEIEAELQASEVDRAVTKMREMQADWQEWEAPCEPLNVRFGNRIGAITILFASDFDVLEKQKRK